MKLQPQTKLSTFLFSGVVLMMMSLGPTTAHAGDESIFFASDIHDAYDTVFSDLFLYRNPDSVYYCCESYALVGDYNSVEGGDYLSVESDDAFLINQMPQFANRILAGGNHDVKPGERALITPSGLVTSMINVDGSSTPLVGGTNYDLFVIDYLDFTNDEMVSALLDYFAQDTHKVLVVLSHYPLHSTRDNDEEWIFASRRFFLLLQAYGIGRDIIFVWGHNHRLAEFDAYVDYVAMPGETIRAADPPSPEIDDMLIDSVADTNLSFTYLNAGYIKPGVLSSNYTIVTIGDTDIEVKRYLYVEDGVDQVETVEQVPRKDLP